MSDSDSDSSDDDLLAGGPTFSKAASRKEKANEKKQLNFLDNLMSKATQRKERNERIGSLMAEANAARAAAAAAAESSAVEGGGGSPSGTSGQGASPSVASATSSASKQSGLGGTANAAAPVKRAMNTYDVDDPEYWERVNAARGPRNSAEGRAKRRRQIDDAVDGIDDLSTDEEGDADDDNAEARKRKKALASARATGLSTLLGTRKVFLPAGMEVNSDGDTDDSPRNGSSSLPFRVIGGPTPRTTTPTFENANDAVAALQKIMDSLAKSAGKRGPVDRKKVEKNVESTILRPLKAACDGGTLVLSQYLSYGTLPSVCSEKSLPVPRQLVTWLFLASCSGAAIRTLSVGACQTLMAIIKSKIRIVDFGAGDNIHINVAMVSDLKPGLEKLFRLWTKRGPSPAAVEEASDEEEEEGDSKKKKRYRASDSYLDNVSGLTHFLSVWATALDYDCIVTKEANVKNEENGDSDLAWDDVESKDVTSAVAALARASLDPTFHSGRHDLINALKWLVVALTDYNARRLTGRGSTSDTDISKLYNATAEAVCDACSGLSAGPEKSADEDDEDGMLPISLGVRSLPIEYSHGRSSTSALKLKAASVLCAFKMCLECDDEWWAESVKDIFAKYAKELQDKELSDRWRIMTSTEVGLRRILSAGNDIMSDYPRFLACIEISVACAEMGMTLFSLLEPSPDGEGGIYGSIDEAEAMCQVLECLEILCNQLKKNMPSVFAYPHLRRGKDVLTLLSAYLRHQMVEASALAQRKGDVNLKQKSLSSFRFSLGGESQLDSSQQQQDDDDDDDDDMGD